MFWTSLFRKVGWAAVTLVLACGTAAAAVAPEAQAVIDRYLEMTGGADAARSIHSLRTHSSASAMGFDGTITLWTRRPHFRASKTELGPFIMSEGFDGETAWRTDPTNGKLVLLDGQDLENAIGNAYFDNEMWLMKDHGGGAVVIARAERLEGRAYIVLAVTPPQGRARDLWFSVSTGLLDRMVMKADHQVIVSHLAGYRLVDGHMIPFHSRTEIEGMPTNTLTANVDSLRANELIADTRFMPPGTDLEPVRYLKTPGIAAMAFDYSARHIWLRASLDGQPPANFIYDTGASVSVLDSAYVARLGIETVGTMQSQGAGAVGSASFAVLPGLRIEGLNGDGVEIRDVKVAVLSINPAMAPFFWRSFAGVIGYDIISRFVNEIDYDARTLTLYEPNGFIYPGKGEGVPFTLAGTMPAVRMKIDGKYEGEFRIDAGSSATVDLHHPFVQRHDLARTIKKRVDVVSGGFGGTFTTQLTRMKRVDLGPFKWNGPIVSLSGARSGALASEDYAGNIGNRILERFKCTFDYEQRMLYLEPGTRYAGPDPFTRAGLQLARFGDIVRAMQVLDGSPAQRAGVRRGDKVVAIAGQPAIDYDPDKLRALFEEGRVGQKVAFEVERGGKRKTLKIRLRDIL